MWKKGNQRIWTFSNLLIYCQNGGRLIQYLSTTWLILASLAFSRGYVWEYFVYLLNYIFKSLNGQETVQDKITDFCLHTFDFVCFDTKQHKMKVNQWALEV